MDIKYHATALMSLIFFIASDALGYNKFCHAKMNAGIAYAPFNLSRASYTMIDTTSTITSYVQLNASDKKRIKKVLNRFDSSTAITPEFIKQFSSSGRSNKNIVGLVLKDFTVIKNEATIGSMLEYLGLEGRQGTVPQ